ncbi:Death domain-associated protein 6 [Paragonimus westermani]|uniref:Death domain-associated protein 6 n=1 Tax=Paragonimus westermani TaxID=34504 RepID=A0A8T0DK85_9TREM|nr:Death domain-associated protein 6 [Paragonimus westermani]
MSIWQEFEKELHKHLPESDEEIIFVLRRKYLRTNKQFRHSKQCKAVLRQCMQRITSQPNRIYMILNDLKATFRLQTTRLSLNITKKPCESSNHAVCEPLGIDLEGKVANNTTTAIPISNEPRSVPTTSCSVASANVVDNDDLIILDLPEDKSVTTDQQKTQISCPTTSQLDIGNDGGTSPSSSLDTSRRALIRRLEQLLSRLGQAIRHLEEEELDFDALESPYSSYMQLDGLKRRYLEVWRRLCDARKVARISGRILLQRFKFTGSKYAEINQRIEHLINDQRKFPDYTDIRRIVSSVNKDSSLGLSSSTVCTLARELFIDVGYMLKRRRQNDLLHDTGCHLTDELCEEDDPTYYDRNLRRQLAHNKHIGDSRLDAVFDKFVQLQYAANDAPLTDTQSSPVAIDTSSSSDGAASEKQEAQTSMTCDLGASDTEQVVPDASEVLTLSSDSDSECSMQQTQGSAPQTVTSSDSNLVATAKSGRPNSSSSVINLTDEDVSSSTYFRDCTKSDERESEDHTDDASCLVPFSSTSALVPNPPIRSTFANFPVNLIAQMQSCSGYPMIRETQHASQTILMTRQYGYNGMHTMLSTTQMATSKMVCQQLVRGVAPAVNTFIPSPPVFPVPRPFRGQLVPSAVPSNQRRNRSSAARLSTDHPFDRRPPERRLSPSVTDTETIVLD